MPRTRPPYPPEFRREALSLMRSGARTPKQLAAELGCSEQTLAACAGVRAAVSITVPARRTPRTLVQTRSVMASRAPVLQSLTSPVPGTGVAPSRKPA